MRVMLGLMGFVLAGCVAQPRSSPTTPLTALLTMPPMPCNLILRIGIEHLPPELSPEDREPRVEPATPRGRSAVPAPAPAVQEPGRRPEGGAQALAAAALARTEQAQQQDPLERQTLLFLSDLLAADSRRVRLQVGLPFFDYAPTTSDPLFLLPGERELRQAQQQWTQENGPQLFQRPLAQLLRRLPFVRELELDLQGARADLLPLTADRGTAPRASNSLGHLSMRLRANRLQDPVELVYVLGGLRVGSSQTTGKLSYELPLTPSLLLEVHARTVYANGSHNLRADLSYRYSEHTSFHAAVGDNMAFVASSGPYSLFDATMAGEAGIVFYAVHLF